MSANGNRLVAATGWFATAGAAGVIAVASGVAAVVAGAIGSGLAVTHVVVVARREIADAVSQRGRNGGSSVVASHVRRAASAALTECSEWFGCQSKRLSDTEGEV